MKEIKAFIRPKKADAVFHALKAKGHCCMTFTECEGTGKYTNSGHDFPSLKFPFMHSEVIKLEIVALKKDVSEIVQLIQENGKTGYPGDGLIYVLDVEEAYKVKNEQKGKEALH